MPPGSDTSLAEGFACFFWNKTETILKSFNPEYHLRVPITFQNDLPRMSSFKLVTLSDVRWLLCKVKCITCLSDTIPTRLFKTHPEAFLPLITRLISDFWYLYMHLEESHSEAPTQEDWPEKYF